jgi:Rieske Fe-S protein
MDPVPQAGPTRRAVLGVAVSVGAAGLVAACGGGDSADPAGSSSPPAGGGGGALTSTADVPVGSGVILADAKVVVTQPTAGTFKAFSSTCTHGACQVTGIAGDRIICFCHASTFSIADGSRKGGPARSPLPEVPVKVEGDEVVRA